MKNILNFVQTNLKMQIKLFIYKLERLLKEKHPRMKFDFYLSRPKKKKFILVLKEPFIFIQNIWT